MTQQQKDQWIAAFLVVLKIVGTAMMLRDTWLVTQDGFASVMIDLAMLAFWTITAYGGRGKAGLAIRPFAAGIAWALYAGQMVIGWEAHQTLAAVVARFAIGGGLLFDTWDYAVALATRNRTPRLERYEERLQTRSLRRALRGGYRALAPDIEVKVRKQLEAKLNNRPLVTVEEPVTVIPPVQVTTPVQRARTPPLSTEQRRDRVVDIIDTTPGVTVTELAHTLNVSRTTIYNDLDKRGVEL